jgi:hypothetical protein
MKRAPSKRRRFPFSHRPFLPARPEPRSFSRALYAALRPSDDYASLYTLRFVNFTSFFWPICGRRRSPGRNGEAD